MVLNLFSIKYTAKRLAYRVLDFLHLTLYWETERARKRIKKERDEEEKYKILDKFLTRIAHKMPIEFVYGNFTGGGECDIKSWEVVDLRLEYYSDRWSLSRVLALYTWVNHYKLAKMMGDVDD